MKKWILIVLLAAGTFLGLTSAQEKPQQPEFIPFSEFSDKRINADGTETLRIASNPINFRQNGRLEKMDFTFTQDAQGWKTSKTPFGINLPTYADGSFTFNYGIGMDRRFLQATSVSAAKRDGQLIYKDAFPTLGASLVVDPKNEGVAYVIEWASRPTYCDTHDNVEVSFVLSASGTVSVGGNSLTKNQEVREKMDFTSGSDKVSIKSAYVWDQKRSEQIPIVWGTVGKQLTGKKVIPCSFFDNAVYPVQSDDSISINSEGLADAVVAYDDGPAVWNTFVTANGNYVNNTTSTVASDYVASPTTDQYYDIYRGAFCFPTGTYLPDNATITAATLGLMAYGKGDFLDIDANVYSIAVPSDSANFATSDYQTAGTTAFSTTIDGSNWTNGWKTFDFNAAGKAAISKTAASCFSTRGTKDVANTTPTWSSGAEGYLQVRYSEYTGTTSDPYFSVTYSLPSPVKAVIII